MIPRSSVFETNTGCLHHACPEPANVLTPRPLAQGSAQLRGGLQPGLECFAVINYD